MLTHEITHAAVGLAGGSARACTAHAGLDGILCAVGAAAHCGGNSLNTAAAKPDLYAVPAVQPGESAGL